MADYRIREMAFDDISPIAEIETRNFSPAEVWDANGFLTHLLREDALYVVAVRKEAKTEPEWQDPEILGYAGILMVPDEADVTKVSVVPEEKRKGIGEALLRELMKMAPSRGIRKIFLEVRESNSAAIRLYEKTGFETVGRRKQDYPTT